MSNFLSNLASRSMGKAEGVLPRLPSLFEPLRSAGLPVLDAPPLEAQEVRETPPARSFRQPLEAPLPAPVRETIAPMPRVEELVAAPERPIDGPLRTKILPVESPRAMAPNLVAPRIPIAPASKMEEARAPSEPDVRRDTPPSFRPMIHTAAAAVSTPQRPPIIPAAPLPFIEPRVTASDEPANRAESKPQLQRANVPEIQPAGVVPAPAPASMPVLIPKIFPRTAGSAPAAAALRARSEESVIHVTIGRIEVRAVSTQTAMPKEKAASPVMSLNDYLRQRSKRGDA